MTTPAPSLGADQPLAHLVVAPGGEPNSTGALVLSWTGDEDPPVAVWWGPLAHLPATSAAEVVAARGGDGSALLPEHSRGAFTRPALRGWRPGAQPGVDSAWSTRFVTTAVLQSDGGVVIKAADEVAGLHLTTQVEGLVGGQLRARHVLRNTGVGDYALEGLDVVVPLPDDACEVLDWTGTWAHEKQPQRAPVRDGLWLRENRRGKTGLDSTGLVVVGQAGFGFSHGTVRSAHVAWSGNTVLRLERTTSTPTTLGGGELLLPGEVVLAPGQSYATPWLHLATSADGLDGAASAAHTWLRSLPAAPAAPVPVTLNVWEAVYFDHDLPRLLELVELAAAAGVERFVLDDGWFGARRDDTAGLGDWTPSAQVWPDGLRPLADAVHAAGMQFGLWFEPEMVNPDSDLYRQHPDWILATAGRVPSLERQQLVLDLSREEVRTHVLDAVSAVLAAAEVNYVKWDHNRDLLEAGSARAGGRPAVSAQTLGFYTLLDELRALHPRVAWESCGSGGGRVDHEALTRIQRVWTSDMTDARERQDIQRWTLQLASPEVLGAHVSASVSHQTGRTFPLDFRAATAFFGAFGIEWDLTAADEDERERLAQWVALHKRHRALLHGGRTFRADTSDSVVRAHGVVSHDRSEAIAAQVQLGESGGDRPVPLRVPGLDPAAQYRSRWLSPDGSPPQAASGRAWSSTDPAGPAGTATVSGSVVATTGLVVPRLQPNSVVLVHLERS